MLRELIMDSDNKRNVALVLILFFAFALGSCQAGNSVKASQHTGIKI